MKRIIFSALIITYLMVLVANHSPPMTMVSSASQTNTGPWCVIADIHPMVFEEMLIHKYFTLNHRSAVLATFPNEIDHLNSGYMENSRTGVVFAVFNAARSQRYPLKCPICTKNNVNNDYTYFDRMNPAALTLQTCNAHQAQERQLRKFGLPRGNLPHPLTC